MKFTKALLGLVLAVVTPTAQGQQSAILEYFLGLIFGRCPISDVCDVSGGITRYAMWFEDPIDLETGEDCFLFVNFWKTRGWECGYPPEEEEEEEEEKCVECFRRLLASGELEIPSTQEQVRDTIHQVGGKEDASFKAMDSVLTLDECAPAIESISGVPQSRKTGDEKNYQVNYSFKELVQMIGRDGALRMYNLFQDAFPGKSVTQIMGRRMEHEGDQYVNFHDDKEQHVTTFMVTLNDDFQGGESIYLNHEGVHVVPATAGSAVAHAPGIVHAAKEINGVRYFLFMVGGSDNPELCKVARALSLGV